MIKYKMEINIEVNSFDSIPGLLQEVEQIISREAISGKIEKEDSDLIKWETKVKQI